MNTASTPKNQVGRLQANWPGSLVGVQDEFDRLFDRFFTGDTSGRSGWLARVDMWEDEGAYHLELEAPGVKQEEIEITFEKGVLRVAVKREEAKEHQGRKYLHRERRTGSAERRISLPETANEEAIEANLSGGVLTITVAKKEEMQPKRIEVKSS